MKNKKLLCTLLSILTVLWIAFIFSNSLEDSVESGAKSAWVYALVHAIIPWVSELFIRKMGHFAEFAILGMLISSTVFAYICPAPREAIKKHLWCFTALPAVFLVGCADEFLQNFIQGRHPAFTDVLIDTAGGLFGIIIILTIVLLIRCSRIKKENRQV